MKSQNQESRKRKVSELPIPQGFENGPVKCKKMRQPHYPPELFKLHALMGFIGMRGSGKTHAMVNLTKKYLEEKSFNRIFIISPTYHSNPIFHVLKPQEEDVYTDPQE
jgi:phosphate starvation-inducible protein PhoH